MKDYYALLRVSRIASEAEIKHAFRRLAILLHPDKNPHPEAPFAFQEINEAYEVLGDPIKKLLYDQMLADEMRIEVAPVIQHPDPAYRRSKAKGYKPSPQEPSAGYVIMMKLMPYTNWVTGLGLIISFFIGLDYFLPRKQSDEVLVEWHRRHDIEMITDKGNVFHLLYPQNLRFLQEPELRIYTSSIFSFIDKIETRSGSYQFSNLPTVFRNLMFGPIVLLFLSFAGQVTPRGEAKFSFAIAAFILLLLNIAFIGVSIW